MAGAQIGEGAADMVEFKAQVSGHKATEKASRIQARRWQHLSDPFHICRRARRQMWKG